MEYGGSVAKGVFAGLFALRYTRLIGHIIGYCCLYQPSQADAERCPNRQDVSVILPTVQPNGHDFEECIRSVLRNKPSALYVVTVGNVLLDECTQVLTQLRPSDCRTKICVSALPMASKRRQVAHAVTQVETDITLLVDDHVFWPSNDFIPAILAPFSDTKVGVVATAKRVVRNTPGEWSVTSIINFLACSYLQRHNWELRASNAIDGGVFVVSGRTAAYRTNFLQGTGLPDRLCNEKFFFGLFGGEQGLGPDDDNFLTREVMKQGLKIRFQDTPEATMETTLGEWPKFRGQLVR
jgi:cellulose synthase/poly-beta-1,6-N-acetylglucosamine synthase-like glycosyltransferase